jgi:hypothetical protein
VHPSVQDAFIPFTEPLEGRVPFMYLDVKSLVSTGVGNLLDADSGEHFGTNPQPLPDIFTLEWFDRNTNAIASNSEIEEEYRTVKFSGTAFASLSQKEAITRLRISDQTINDLVTRKLFSFEDTLRNRPPFTLLDQWPADGQLGLFSMAWGLGPAFRFPKFEAAAAAQDWLTMAHECKMREEGNPGVIPRNVRNALLFTIADWMAAPPPGEFSALVYDPFVHSDSRSRNLAENLRSQNFPIFLGLVVGLQTALEFLGFDPNGLDGVAGPGLKSALHAFQSSQGLPATPDFTTIDDLDAATHDAIIARLDEQGFSHFP